MEDHMTIYIALLRGINVGGKNIIKMADLKLLFESMGLIEVRTYIQSGNVLFKSSETEEELRNKIERKIEEVFGFAIVVILRSAEEINSIINNCPFSELEIAEAESASEAESLYVSLMPHAPSHDKVKDLNIYGSERDKYKIIGREIYLLFHDSIRNSKLANNLLKVHIPATVRNWKTLNKLAVLANAMDK
jgi:uncharacterized protein (DUF1697 family)